MRTLFAAAALLIAVTAHGQVSEGDQHWNARAEGHTGGRANGAQVGAAIAAYERAIAQNPNDLEPRWKLLRALRFKGAYVAASENDKRAVFAAGKSQGEAALAALGRRINIKGSEKQVADAARTIPGAAEIFMWDAVNWGEWALVYGKMAAVRQGAADRIRREAMIAYLIDPRVEGGGPGRVLGRLHDETPHIPFVTGWASTKEAVRFLTEANRIDPSNKITRLFLAEALVDNDSHKAGDAIRILRDIISSPNDPHYEVEDAAAQEDARALLQKWGA